MRKPSRFELTARPTMKENDEGVTSLESVEFIAKNGREVRCWLVKASQLSILTDVLSPGDAQRSLTALNNGNPVTFEEELSAVHLVLLGYRVLNQKKPRATAVPGGLYSKAKERRVNNYNFDSRWIASTRHRA